MSYLNLFRSYLRVSAMSELQYRANFFIQVFDSLIKLFVGLFGLYLVFSYTDSLGGWSQAELLAVMGVYTLVGGLIRTFIDPNMQRLQEDVQQGTLDYALTKPEDSQWLISVRETRLWQLTDVALGIGVTAFAVWQLREAFGLPQLAAFVFLLALGTLMIYSVWLMFTASAFWFVRVGDVFDIFEGMVQTGRYPVGIYPSWLQGVLTFLVPIAFAITLPSEALTNRLTLPSLGLAVFMALTLFTAARLLWRAALRRYSGASA
jgi:ABC-2 type transport system permease protein